MSIYEIMTQKNYILIYKYIKQIFDKLVNDDKLFIKIP